jgi:hypothetical protein
MSIRYTDQECKNAQRRLIEVQPTADDFRFSLCHCRKKALMVSYTLPGDQKRHKQPDEEDCGYWCARCGWGNAGARSIKPTEGEF